MSSRGPRSCFHYLLRESASDCPHAPRSTLSRTPRDLCAHAPPRPGAGGSRTLARRPLGVPSARPRSERALALLRPRPQRRAPLRLPGGGGRGQSRLWRPCGGPMRPFSGCCCAGPGPWAPPPARSPVPQRCWRATCCSGVCRTGPPSACPTAPSATTSSASRTSTGPCRAPTTTSCAPAASPSSSTTAPRPPGTTWPGRTGSSRRSRLSTSVSGPGRWSTSRRRWPHCLQSTLTNALAPRPSPRP